MLNSQVTVFGIINWGLMVKIEKEENIDKEIIVGEIGEGVMIKDYNKRA